MEGIQTRAFLPMRIPHGVQVALEPAFEEHFELQHRPSSSPKRPFCPP